MKEFNKNYDHIVYYNMCNSVTIITKPKKNSLHKSSKICDGLQETDQIQPQMGNMTCHNIIEQCAFVHVDFKNMIMDVAIKCNFSLNTHYMQHPMVIFSGSKCTSSSNYVLPRGVGYLYWGWGDPYNDVTYSKLNPNSQ